MKRGGRVCLALLLLVPGNGCTGSDAPGRAPPRSSPSVNASASVKESGAMSRAAEDQIDRLPERRGSTAGPLTGAHRRRQARRAGPRGAVEGPRRAEPGASARGDRPACSWPSGSRSTRRAWAGGGMIRDRRIIAVLLDAGITRGPGLGRDASLEGIQAYVPPDLIREHEAPLVANLKRWPDSALLLIVAKGKLESARPVVDALVATPRWVTDEAALIAKAAFGDPAAERRFVDPFLATTDPREKMRLGRLLGFIGTRGPRSPPWGASCAPTSSSSSSAPSGARCASTSWPPSTTTSPTSPSSSRARSTTTPATRPSSTSSSSASASPGGSRDRPSSPPSRASPFHPRPRDDDDPRAPRPAGGRRGPRPSPARRRSARDRNEVAALGLDRPRWCWPRASPDPRLPATPLVDGDRVTVALFGDHPLRARPRGRHGLAPSARTRWPGTGTFVAAPQPRTWLALLHRAATACCGTWSTPATSSTSAGSAGVASPSSGASSGHRQAEQRPFLRRCATSERHRRKRRPGAGRRVGLPDPSRGRRFMPILRAIPCLGRALSVPPLLGARGRHLPALHPVSVWALLPNQDIDLSVLVGDAAGLRVVKAAWPTPRSAAPARG